MQEEPATLPIGAVIRKRYIVEGLLGKGSSGAVYLVRDQRTRSDLFALKKVIVQSKHELYRSLLEYQLLLHLDHPALAHVHSLLKDDQRHRTYMLMEYIQGSNLETLRQQQPEQRFSWLETMNIMASIIAAVNYLHGQQPPIIHGDIKPTDIIVPKAGSRAILVDFGTAKHYDLDSRTGVMERSAFQFLAPTVRSCYRAPEHYTTGPSIQTDIYSLGATFYTLVTGIVPTDAPSRLTQVSNGEIDPLQPVNEVQPTIPTRVARTIDRAMALEADSRFLSVERFWEALWSLVEHSSSLPGDVPSASSHPPRVHKQEVVRPAVVSVPKQPRAPRAWKFGPFWPFTAKQAVARPAIVSTPKQRAPRIEKPGALWPLAAKQALTRPDTIFLPKHPPPVPSSEPAISEQAVEEAVPRAVEEQQHMAPTSKPAGTEHVIEEPAPALVTEQPPPVSPLEPAIPEQAVEATAPTSEPAVAEQAVEETAPALMTEQPSPLLPSEPAISEPEGAVEHDAAAMLLPKPPPVVSMADNVKEPEDLDTTEPLPKLPPVIPMPDALKEPEDPDTTKSLSVVSMADSVKEPEDLDASEPLPKPSPVVPMPDALKEPEGPDTTKSLPEPPPVVPVPETVKEPEDLEAAKSLPEAQLVVPVPDALKEPEGLDAAKPLPEPPQIVPVPDAVKEQEDLDDVMLLPKPPSVISMADSAKESEDLEATLRLLKPPVVSISEDIKEQEGPAVAQHLPEPARVVPVFAGVKGRESPDITKLLSRLPRVVQPPISLRKLGILFIILTVLISLGIGAAFLSRAQSHPTARSTIPAPTTTAPAPTPPSTAASSRYPRLAGAYIGTIYDLSDNVQTSMFLAGMQQTQGSFTGRLILGPGMKSGGLFKGTINMAKYLQFTVMDAAGYATLFFEGAVQSATSLSGDYYQCSPGPVQGSSCSRIPGSYGLWNVLVAPSGNSSPPSQSDFAEISRSQQGNYGRRLDSDISSS